MTNPTMRTAIIRRTLAAAFVVIALALSSVGYWYYRSQPQSIHQSNYEAISIAIGVGTFVLLLALATAFAYTWQHAKLFRKLYESERHERETQGLYRATLYSIADGVLTTDTQGRLLEMNAVAERFTGWTEAEARGKPSEEVFVIIDHATRAALPNPVTTVLRDGAMVGLGLAHHTLLIARDGSECSIADSAAPIRDESGVVRGVVLVFSDATVQDDLRKEQEFTKLVLDNIPGIFYLYSYPENRLILWNKQHESLLGYTCEEMQGRHATDWFAQEDKEAISNAIEGVMEKGQNSIEAPMVGKDGHRVPLLLTGVKFESENKFYFIGIGTDITEQKQKALELLASLHELKTLKDAVDEHAIVAITNPQGLITYVNDKFCALSKYSREELLGQDHRILTSGYHPKDYLRNLWETIGQGRVWKGELMNRKKDGTFYWLDTTITPFLDAEGKPYQYVAIRTDITALKQAQVDLMASLEELNRLKAAVDEHAIVDITKAQGQTISLGDKPNVLSAYSRGELLGKSVTITDPHGQITYINDKFCALSKYSREELIGRDHRILKSGYHPNEFFRDLWETISAGRVWKGEVKNRAKDGTFYWVDTTIVPFLDTEGKPYKYVAIRTDITARKQVVEALRESEARFRVLVEQAGDGFELLDEDGRFLDMNPSTCQQMGFSREELLRMRVPDIDPVVNWEQFAATFPAMEKKPVTFETVHTRKDGTQFPVEVTVSCIRMGNNRRLISLVRDITERRKREQEIRQLTRAVEQSPSIVVITDTHGVIQYVNPAFTETAGYTFEEALGQNPRILKSGETPIEVYKELWDTIKAGRAWRGDFHNKRKNGELYWESATISPIFDENGVITQFLGVKKDITERKQVEEALLKAKQAADAANQAKDQFIAVLSHELRTPLTPVLATVSALQTQEDLPADLRADMGLIRRNVEMEAALIDDLLDVTRISRGKIVLQRETVDVHGCLRTVSEICRKEIQEKRQEIHSEFHATQHLVWADPVRLRQVFWNLLKNAIKFTDDDGQITLRTHNVGDRVQIEIADTGIGIEPESMPRIFNLFEQGEQSRTRQFGGLGLGLHIARAVVEMHEGRLSAFSEGKDKGAVFTVELATIAPQEKPAPPAPSVVPQERPLRILLVEDHPDTIQVLTKLLKKWGHTVSTAENVKTAQELADGQEFDLLISDLGLPDGSGMDVMRRVKERSGIPGIALSGYGTDEDIRQSRDAGFAEHLVKPVNIVALRTAIQKVAFAGS